MNYNRFSFTPESLKAHASDTARMVGEHFSEKADVVRKATLTARDQTQDYIEGNPWQSIAVAALGGFMLGAVVVLASRR